MYVGVDFSSSLSVSVETEWHIPLCVLSIWAPTAVIAMPGSLRPSGLELSVNKFENDEERRQQDPITCLLYDAPDLTILDDPVSGVGI